MPLLAVGSSLLLAVLAPRYPFPSGPRHLRCPPRVSGKQVPSRLQDASSLVVHLKYLLLFLYHRSHPQLDLCLWTSPSSSASLPCSSQSSHQRCHPPPFASVRIQRLPFPCNHSHINSCQLGENETTVRTPFGQSHPAASVVHTPVFCSLCIRETPRFQPRRCFPGHSSSFRAEGGWPSPSAHWGRRQVLSGL